MEEKKEAVAVADSTAEKKSDGKMSKAEFWIRFSIWIILAVIVPVAYLACSYGLFTSGATKLTGWGILAIIFVCVVMLSILHQAKAGLSNGSMAKQCIDGYEVLLPLLCVILAIDAMKDNVESFERFLIVMLACEAVAVPINPMRKWGYQNNVDALSQPIAETVKKILKKGK